MPPWRRKKRGIFARSGENKRAQVAMKRDEQENIERAHEWARQVEKQQEKEKKGRFVEIRRLLESDHELATAYAKSWKKKPLPYRGGDKRTKRRRRLSSKKRKYTKKHKKTRRRRR